MAQHLGLRSGWAVSKWARVPAERVIPLCAATQWAVTPHQMRPDLYPHPCDGLPFCPSTFSVSDPPVDVQAQSAAADGVTHEATPSLAEGIQHDSRT